MCKQLDQQNNLHLSNTFSEKCELISVRCSLTDLSLATPLCPTSKKCAALVSTTCTFTAFGRF